MSVRAPPQGRGPAGGGPPTPGHPQRQRFLVPVAVSWGLSRPRGRSP